MQMTRRAFTRKEIEENDFNAYIASSSEDESDVEAQGGAKGKGKKADRDRLRALLLSGGDDLPEGWGGGLRDDAVPAPLLRGTIRDLCQRNLNELCLPSLLLRQQSGTPAPFARQNRL